MSRSAQQRTAEQFDRDWQHVIDGEFRPASDGGRLDVVYPATGEAFTTAPDGTAEDVEAAIEAARTAFEDWRWTSPSERAGMLEALADRIEAHHDELVELETRENGKPLSQSARDVRAAAKTFRYYAGGIDKFYSDSVSHTRTEVKQKVFEPHGVVGVIIPWNWPPMHTADFAAVALAAGNTVVLKPSPDTPLSSLRIAEFATDILPDGVLNVVSGGTEPGVALTSSPDVDMIAFTGHDRTGEKVLAAAAEHITPTMMELGGKNPAIVFDDANLERTVDGVISSAFFNSGQACSDAERLLLHEDVADAFVERLSAAVEALVVGDGHDDATQIGPMVNELQVEKFDRYLEVATDEGAEVLAQSSLPDDPDLEGGYWVAPTLLGSADQAMRIMQEEVFGPVLAATTFADEAEAVAKANDVDYGLTATIWTEDVGRAHRVASQVEAGVVAVNATGGGGLGMPFGGYKRSGIGRKKDFTETMRQFSQVKTIRIDLTDEPFSL